MNIVTPLAQGTGSRAQPDVCGAAILPCCHSPRYQVTVAPVLQAEVSPSHHICQGIGRWLRPQREKRFQLSHGEAPGPVEAAKGKVETRQCPFLGSPCWVVIDTEDSQKSWLGESIREAAIPLTPPHPPPPEECSLPWNTPRAFWSNQGTMKWDWRPS